MKYEYIIREDLNQTELNDYGEKGWELVAVVRLLGNCTYFYFKKTYYGGK